MNSRDVSESSSGGILPWFISRSPWIAAKIQPKINSPNHFFELENVGDWFFTKAESVKAIEHSLWEERKPRRMRH